MTAEITAISESELITLVTKKSTKGFELLYDTYASSLYSVTLTIIPDRQIAVNALQAAFCEIWRNLSHFDAGKMRLFTWMYQITRSTALRYHHTIADHPVTTADLYTTGTDTTLGNIA